MPIFSADENKNIKLDILKDNAEIKKEQSSDLDYSRLVRMVGLEPTRFPTRPLNLFFPNQKI